MSTLHPLTRFVVAMSALVLLVFSIPMLFAPDFSNDTVMPEPLAPPANAASPVQPNELYRRCLFGRRPRQVRPSGPDLPARDRFQIGAGIDAIGFALFGGEAPG